MADFDGYVAGATSFTSKFFGQSLSGDELGTPPAFATLYDNRLATKNLDEIVTRSDIKDLIYIMRATDANSVGSSPTYRVWTVSSYPDYNADYYDGDYDGSEINFTNVILLGEKRI